MSKKGRDGLEPEIIISTLKHTNIPTLLVEGTGDVGIYRWLEKRLGVGKVDILQCGGRSDLLEIYSRRGEFDTKPVVFLADLDDYIYFGVNIKYNEIIFTSGYSIENDIICDNSIDYLFDESEKSDFENALTRMIEIYSEKVSRRSSDPSEDLALHPSTYYDFERSAFITSNIFEQYQKDELWFDHIKADPKILIRGKNIVSLYAAILSRTSRQSKFSKANIVEIHLKQSALPMPIARTLVKIRYKFRALGIAI
ncbi:DUF4435 domain-containing protein [Deinococcus sp. AJ005]|uniref:DUF4435 domain-containing protein n=1 Tax=Deinococcus sp. AJ005 TaxID=2652443 RepID=UPI00186571E4|nr:DUF4435 domain-containing protein [Deinococcus sp. AJ005]